MSPSLLKTIAEGLGAVETLKRLIPKFPDQRDKDEAERALRYAEVAFQVAQAEIARKLEYPICRRHWPPEIMLLNGYCDPYTEEFRCPKCEAVWPGPEPPSTVMEG